MVKSWNNIGVRQVFAFPEQLLRLGNATHHCRKVFFMANEGQFNSVEAALKHAVLKEGFSLEFKASQLLPNSICNKLYLDGESGNQVEIDVVGSIAGSLRELGGSRITVVCECKGGSSDCFLVMIEAPKMNNEKITFPAINISQSRKRITLDETFTDSLVAFTGDFFVLDSKLKSKKFGNLYKGISQLEEGFSAYISENTFPKETDREPPHFVIPLLITNVPIRMARFSFDGKENKVVSTLAELPWVIYKNQERNNNLFVTNTCKWSGPGANDRQIKYFWIVNVDSLEKFLKKHIDAVGPSPNVRIEYDVAPVFS